MGAWRPTTPSKYSPDSARRMKEELGDAILAHMRRHNLTSIDIYRRYKSVRPADIREIEAGGASFYGLNRLLAICEALGIRAELKVAA